MKLGEYLKEARINKNLSQRDLAKSIDRSNAYISKIEKGIILNPSPLLLQKIIKCLDLDYSYVMELAGYISNHQDLLEYQNTFRYEKLKEWLKSQGPVSKMALDYEILTTKFDAIVTIDETDKLLKIIDDFRSNAELLVYIKSAVLDLVLNAKENIELDIIFPVDKVIISSQEKIINDLKDKLSYLPVTINYYAL